MTSLYDQNPAPWDKLAADGKPNLRELAKRVSDTSQMDHALGYQGAARHWARGEGAKRTSDRRAREWLDAQSQPAPTPDPTPSDSGLILVAVPSGMSAKVAKVLTLMGCEVVEDFA